MEESCNVGKILPLETNIKHLGYTIEQKINNIKNKVQNSRL